MGKHKKCDKEGHSKYYWEEGRNGYYYNTTLDRGKEPVSQEQIEKEINPKMLMSKEELGLWDDNIPEYYKGANGYEARRVCDNFDLTYHLATAVTYLLRAYRKHETPVSDIKKAIAHLEFELDKYGREKGKK